jgi:hypothetical protein
VVVETMPVGEMMRSAPSALRVSTLSGPARTIHAVRPASGSWIRLTRVGGAQRGARAMRIVASASLGPALARRIERDLAGANSWQVTVNDDGALRWTSDAGERDTQPARNFWQRMQNLLFKLAPASYY